MTPGFWNGRTVVLTGHTGFKGGWLALKLARCGAKVIGISLDPETDPSLFGEAKIADHVAQHHICDIRDGAALDAIIAGSGAEIVLHLAAQPLVRESYADPLGTFSTNVMGLANLLDSCSRLDSLKALVNVTTDKVYDNQEWPWAYREDDRLGGRDPYSASKACAELVTRAWRSSFLEKRGVAVATARAGNVIGGGDWAKDRLVPDALKAFGKGEELVVRSPHSVRPWQHVLEPLEGYVALAEALATRPQNYADAWNFGPADEDAKPVNWIADHLCTLIDGAHWRVDGDGGPPEQGLLKVDSSKARGALDWAPRWDLARALEKTVEWDSRWRAGENAAAICLEQIEEHEAA